MWRLASVLVWTLTAGAADRAVVWKRWELVVDGTAAAVTFTGPGGHRIVAPAFPSAGRVRARIAFPRAGAWKWAAAGRTGRVQVAAYTGSNPLYRHGFLRVSRNGRYLEHADGTPFLWMGDTPWYALAKATDAEWRDLLGLRAKAGFSVIQVAALGPPTGSPLSPFDASGEPNPVYWDLVDARLREANDRGLVVLMVGLARPPRKEDLPDVANPRYAREVVARLFGDHVILSPNFDQVYNPLFDELAERLRSHTALHLITQHPNTQDGQNDLYVPKPYLSFSGLQSGHHSGRLDRAYTAAREWPVRLRSLEPVKPVINIEAMYDGRGNDDGPAWRAQDSRKLGWISWLSGALGYTYGAGETARKVPGSNGGMWGFNQDPAAWDYWRKVAEWPSARHMTVLRDFFAGIHWWRLEPAPERVRNGEASPEARPAMAVANDRSFAVVYTPVRAALTIDRTGLFEPGRAEWLDPLTGGRSPASPDFLPPSGDHDWVLLLSSR